MPQQRHLRRRCPVALGRRHHPEGSNRCRRHHRAGTTPQTPVSDEYYYIVSDKCTECVGFHEEPQCAAVCPVDCCVDDPDYRETRERLLEKKDWLHIAA